MNPKWKVYCIRCVCWSLYFVGFLPFLIVNMWHGLLTGIRLGRLDFENELRERKDETQRELFRLSSYRPVNPEEVLKNGKWGY